MDNELLKKKAKYGFEQKHVEEYDIEKEKFDITNSQYMSDLIRAESTYSGKMAQEEYILLAKYQEGPPPEITKESQIEDWKKAKKKELRELRKRRRAFEAEIGGKAYEAQEDFSEEYAKYKGEPVLEAIKKANKSIRESEKYRGLFDISQDTPVSDELLNMHGADNAADYKEIVAKFKEGTGIILDGNVEENREKNEKTIKDFKSFLENKRLPLDLLGIHGNMLSEEMCMVPEVADMIIKDIMANLAYNYANRMAADPNNFARTNKKGRDEIDLDAHVNKEQLAKWNAIKTYNTKMVDSLISYNGFKDFEALMASAREKYHEEKEAEKEVNDIISGQFGQTDKVEFVEKKLVLIENSSLIFGKWEIEDRFVEPAIKHLKNKFGERIDPADDGFVRYVEAMNSNLHDNLELLNSILDGEHAEVNSSENADNISIQDIYLQNSVLRGKLFDIILGDENLSAELFDEWMTTANKSKYIGIIKNIARDNVEKFDKYRQTAKKIKENLSELSAKALDNIISKDRLGVILDEKLSEEEKDDRINAAKQNMESNYALLKELVDKNVTSYTAKETYEVVKDVLGDNIIFASPAILKIITSRVVNALRLEQGGMELSNKEKAFVEICKEKKLDKKYWNYAGERCREDNVKTEKGKTDIKLKISQMVSKINERETEFTGRIQNIRMNRSKWRELFNLKESLILDEKFWNEITGFIQTNQSAGELSVTYEEFVHRTRYKDNAVTEEVQRLQNTKGFYQERLEGSDLMDWPVFDNFKLSDIDKQRIFDCAVRLITDNNSELRKKPEFDFLKNVDSLETLDRISEKNYSKTINFIRLNLVENIARWSEYNGAYQDRMKEYMLEKICLEKLDASEYDRLINDKADEMAKDAEIGKKKLMLELEREILENKNIEYRVLGIKAEKDYFILQGKELKPQDRIKCYMFAREAWRMVDKIGKQEEINRFLFALMNRVEIAFETDEKVDIQKKIDRVNDLYREIRNAALKFKGEVEKSNTIAKMHAVNDKLNQKKIEVAQKKLEIENKKNDVETTRTDIAKKKIEVEQKQREIEQKQQEEAQKKKEVEQKKSELKHAKTKEEKQKLEVEQKNLEAERKKLEDERKKLEEERKEIEKEQARIEKQQINLKKEQKKMEEEQDKLEKEKGAIEKERLATKVENDNVDAKVKDFFYENFINYDVLIGMDEQFKAIKTMDGLGRDKYFLEFLLKGHERQLFGHHADYQKDFQDKDFARIENEEESFLEYGDENYRESVYNNSYRILTRYREIDDVLSEIEINTKADTGTLRTTLVTTQRLPIYKKLERFVTGFKEVKIRYTGKESGGSEILNQMENNKRYNLEKFGFATFEDMLNELKKDAQNLLGDLEDSEERINIRKHMEILSNYEGGLYDPVKDILLENNQFFKKMLTLDDEAFVSYLDELKNTIGIPMSVLKSDYGLNKALNKQFVMEYEKAIMSNTIDGKELTKQDWEKFRDDYQKAIIDTKIGGRRSIEERVKKGSSGIVVKEEAIAQTWAKLNVFINEKPDEFAVLLKSDELKKTLKTVDVQIDSNTEKLKLYDEKHQEILNGHDSEWKNKRDNFFLYKIYTTKTDQFDDAFIEKAQKEFEEELVKKAPPLIDRKHLDELGAARLKVETEKQLGVLKDEDYASKIKELEDVKYHTGSMLYNKFYKDTVAPVEKAGQEEVGKKIRESIKDLNKKIEDARKKDITLEAFPEFIVEMVAEAYAGKPGEVKDEEKLSELKRVNAIYAKLSEKHGQDSDEEKQKLMIHYYINEGNIKVASDNDVEKSVQDLKEKESELAKFKKKVFAFHDGLSLGCQEFLDAMSVAVYTYDKDKFISFVQKRLNYFQAATKVYDEMDKLLEGNSALPDGDENKLSPDNLARTRLGLKDYIHASILEYSNKEDGTINIEELKKKMSDALENKMIQRYLYESQSVFGKVAYDDLTENEKGAVKTDTRKDMEKIILSQEKGFLDRIMLRDNPEVVTKYANLNLEQKKLFALAISMPVVMTENENLLGARLLRDEEKDRQETDEILGYVQKYIEGEDFDPKINYTRVMRRIVKEDGSLNKEIFEMAYKFTMAVTATQQAAIPKDFKKLNSSREGLEALERNGILQDHVKKLDEVKEKVSTKESFMNELFKLAHEDENTSNGVQAAFENFKENKLMAFEEITKKVTSPLQSIGIDLTQKLSSREINLANAMGEVMKNDADFRILIAILQDRTALDFSTNTALLDMTKIKEVAIVNPALRNELKERFNRANDENLDEKLANTIGESEYKKAMENLFSYQVRDDVEIGDMMSDSHFTKTAMARKSFVDWTLLSRALDLLNEIKEESNKIKALRLSRENITREVNELAYNKYIDLDLNKEQAEMKLDKFDEVIKTSSEISGDESDTAALMLGFNALSQKEKVLFIKALQHRDILDISRDNLYASFFGQAERDYVNQKGRDDLIDEFISKTLNEETSMSISDEEIANAMKSLLSTQIDDTRDMESEESFKSLSVGGKIYEIGQNRKTAIDWKLFKRALQLVHRTMEERDMIIGNRELYRSQGDLKKNGRFAFNSELMRKNIHSSGSRINRFFFRQGISAAMDLIPYASYAQMGLAAILSQSQKNALAGYNQFGADEEEEQQEDSIIWKLEGYAKNAQEGLSDKHETVSGINESIKDKMGSDLLEKANLSDASETMEAVLGDIEQTFNGIDTVRALVTQINNKREISKLYKIAEENRVKDDENAENAKKYQNERQQRLSAMALHNNRYIMGKVAKTLTDTQLNQEIVGSVLEFTQNLLGYDRLKEAVLKKETLDMLDENDLLSDSIEKAIEVAKETILFIMQAVKEKKMLDKYFDSEGPFGEEIQELRKGTGKLSTKQQEKVGKMGNRELAQNAHGFENFTEQSSFVCMKIVNSILFSASAQNPVIENRLKGIAILTIMDMKEDIGKMDTDTQEKLYSKFMGEEYR